MKIQTKNQQTDILYNIMFYLNRICRFELVVVIDFLLVGH